MALRQGKMALKEVKGHLNHGQSKNGEQKVVSPVGKLERGIFQQAQSRLYHPKSTLRRQLELKEKAKLTGKQFVKQPKGIAKKREVIEKLHNVGYFE